MVLEFIYSPQKILKRPSIIFFEAVFISLMSVVFSVYIFPKQYISIGILAFITIGLIPIFAKLFSYNSYLFNYSEGFFQRHKTLIFQIMYVFLGIFVAFIFLFFVVSSQTRDVIFATQFSEIKGVEEIRNSITGQVSATQIKENKFSMVFNIVFKNNLGVILRAAALSFFYGAGAIFLIAWNASILAVVIANNIFLGMGGPVGVLDALQGIGQSLVNLLGYVPHGLPEMLAYFIVSFAGAIFARDLMKGLFTTEFRLVVIKDLLWLIFIAMLLLVIGALIEASYFL